MNTLEMLTPNLSCYICKGAMSPFEALATQALGNLLYDIDHAVHEYFAENFVHCVGPDDEFFPVDLELTFVNQPLGVKGFTNCCLLCFKKLVRQAVYTVNERKREE